MMSDDATDDVSTWSRAEVERATRAMGMPRRAGGAPFALRAARGAITGAPRRLAEAWR